MSEEKDGTSSESYVEICHCCDMGVTLPTTPDPALNYRCPRCGAVLIRAREYSFHTVGTIALSALIMLFASLTQPFMTLEQFGVINNMSLYNVLTTLRLDWGGLLYVFMAVTLFMPLVVLFLAVAVGLFSVVPSLFTMKVFSFCHRYCMVDVFIMGVLISLIKLTSLANVSFHFGFFSAVIFSVMMTWCWMHLRPNRLWALRGHSHFKGALAGKTGYEQNLVVCRTCGAQYPGDEHGAVCPRCGRVNHYRNPSAIQRTCALLLAATILYLPSNLYPVMYTDLLGASSGSNIIDGVIALWHMNSHFVALVILIASIFIPILKILMLLFLVFNVITPGRKSQEKRLVLIYRLVEYIGKWSMIDVFVVIIMSSVVRIGGLVTINPGFAIVAFCAVVILTLISAEQFDSRMIWDRRRNCEQH
ncbi:paraquat-inducible protein A [Succinivibrio dextrinosolvens]|uniref:paraquat-inducible protein A n=1 Tax=Succinivibrio dextrinosolvens TaxID=83771 RepID=UPI0009DDA822|nr:paraquat-inducible protein A [Succinivibrio dextrinosolvens]MBE6423219.1 paraquat-inducible protein A [Succinivibrio dextrinosolvens]